MFSANERRESVFQGYAETTLEVLSQPQVEDALGERTTQLRESVAESFAIPRNDDFIDLPEEQRNNDAMGVHPVVRTELRMPSVRMIDWVCAEDQKHMANEFPESWAEFTKTLRDKATDSRGDNRLERLSIASATYGNGMIHRPPDDQDVLLRYRNFIIVKHSLMVGTSALATAAVLGHEFDHARQPHRFGRDEAKAYRRHRNDAYGMRLESVAGERSAYAVSAGMLAPMPDGPEVHEAVTTALHGLKPHDAGQMLNKMLDSRSGLPEKWRDDAHRLLVTSAGAMCLTKMFSGASPDPTLSEVFAYESAGLVH